jgi:hypothetical protein
MRLILIATAATAAAILVSEPSQAYQGPWCAGYSVGHGTWREECTMPSFEVCRQYVIAGNRGFCSPNPYWHAAVTEPVRKRVKRRR